MNNHYSWIINTQAVNYYYSYRLQRTTSNRPASCCGSLITFMRELLVAVRAPPARCSPASGSLPHLRARWESHGAHLDFCDENYFISGFGCLLIEREREKEKVLGRGAGRMPCCVWGRYTINMIIDKFNTHVITCHSNLTNLWPWSWIYAYY